MAPMVYKGANPWVAQHYLGVFRLNARFDCYLLFLLFDPLESMPRRKSGKKRKSRGKGALGPNLMGKTVRVPFRNCFYCVLSEVKGFNVYNLNIGFDTAGFFGDVATQVATGYERFRCTKLRIKARPPRIFEQQNTNSSFQAGIGYSAFGASGAPGGFASMCQMDSFALGSGANESCSMTLNRKTLVGQSELKWYFVKHHGTESTSELYQGTVWYATWTDFTLDSQWRIWFEVDGELEFCDPFEPSVLITDHEAMRIVSLPHEQKELNGAGDDDYVPVSDNRLAACKQLVTTGVSAAKVSTLAIVQRHSRPP